MKKYSASSAQKASKVDIAFYFVSFSRSWGFSNCCRDYFTSRTFIV